MVDYVDIANVLLPGSKGYVDLYKKFCSHVAEVGSSENVISELELAAKEAKINANVLITQAQVEQENSITARILLADEVEIEEYYDISGSGNLGLKTEAIDSIALGLNAEGRKVSKRVIKFKGFNEHVSEELISKLMGAVENNISEK